MGGMSTVEHPTTDELDAGLAHLRASPADHGLVELVLRRPAIDEREVLDVARLEVGVGVVGDHYLARGSSATPDGAAHPEAQLNVMNSRAADLVAAGVRQRWTLAGDQLFVDLDLSVDNLPVGTRLAVGSAIIEVAAKPHNGCAKFRDRFGAAAATWVNRSKEQRRRGLCAVVVEPGEVRPGDIVSKLT
jgi:MOSC domain-containing protein YiiM